MMGRAVVWWSVRETRFLGWTIGIGLIAAALFAPILFLTQVATSMEQPQVLAVTFIGGLPTFYVVSRLSLVLPATAIDLTPSFEWAWRASRHNGIRLMFAIGLLPLLIQMLIVFMPVTQFWLFEAAKSLVGVCAIVVEVAALSMSYRELVRDQPAPESRAKTF